MTLQLFNTQFVLMFYWDNDRHGIVELIMFMTQDHITAMPGCSNIIVCDWNLNEGGYQIKRIKNIN